MQCRPFNNIVMIKITKIKILIKTSLNLNFIISIHFCANFVIIYYTFTEIRFLNIY